MNEQDNPRSISPCLLLQNMSPSLAAGPMELDQKMTPTIKSLTDQGWKIEKDPFDKMWRFFRHEGLQEEWFTSRPFTSSGEAVRGLVEYVERQNP